MDKLNPTFLQDVIFAASERFKSGFENRFSEYGGFAAIQQDSARGLLPNSFIESTKTAYTQPTKAPVLKKYTATDVDEVSCSTTGQQSESAFIDLTWQKFGFAVQHIPAIYGDNYIAAQEDMIHKMVQGFKRVYARIDTAALAFLETNKTAQNPTSSFFTNSGSIFNYTGDADKVYAYVPALMSMLDLEGPYFSVGDTEHKSNLLMTSTLGVQNSQNLAGLQNGSLQYAGQFDQFFSNRLAKSTNKNKFYIAPQGTTTVLNWTHPQFRQGLRVDESHYFTTASDPLFGLQWEMSYKATCADVATAVSGVTTGTRSVPPATKVEEYWFGLKIAFARQYSSDNTTPIVAFTLNNP